MTGLVEFLKARLEQDGSLAQACLDEVGSIRKGEMYEDGSGVADQDEYPHYPYGSGPAELAFMARFHPADILTDVDAKRRLVDLHPHGVWPTRKGDGHLHCETCDVEDGVIGGDGRYCLTLRLLALPYASHPEYDESWRP